MRISDWSSDVCSSDLRGLVVDRLVQLLNEELYPVIPAKGSVGASGDLAPLAHLSAVLLGHGEISHRGRRRPAREVLGERGIEPIALAAKEDRKSTRLNSSH